MASLLPSLLQSYIRASSTVRSAPSARRKGEEDKQLFVSLCEFSPPLEFVEAVFVRRLCCHLSRENERGENERKENAMGIGREEGRGDAGAAAGFFSLPLLRSILASNAEMERGRKEEGLWESKKK